MNRRNFIRNSALALFGFAVLPSAETYQRVWRAQKKPVWEIYWTQTNCAARCFDEQYLRTIGLIEENMGLDYQCILERPKPHATAREITDSIFFGVTINENFSNA